MLPLALGLFTIVLLCSGGFGRRRGGYPFHFDSAAEVQEEPMFFKTQQLDLRPVSLGVCRVLRVIAFEICIFSHAVEGLSRTSLPPGARTADCNMLSAGGTELSEQNELWDIEKTRRASRRRQLDLNMPASEEVVMRPVSAEPRRFHKGSPESSLWQQGETRMRADSHQERNILGAMSSIESRLERGAHREQGDMNAPSSAQHLWQSGGPQANRASFWDSVGAAEQARRDALFRVGQAHQEHQERAHERAQPAVSGAAAQPQNPPDGGVPVAVMSLQTEKERRRGDENFVKKVQGMMQWNSDKMKEMIKSLHETRDKIRKEREVGVHWTSRMSYIRLQIDFEGLSEFMKSKVCSVTKRT